MSNTAPAEIDDHRTVWRPGDDSPRRLILAAILKNSPIPVAYRVNFVANFYVGPLIKKIEQRFKMTRPEWIVLFCLYQRSGLNAQQISTVSGRPKTSISAAIAKLQKRKLILRRTDVEDGRRQVLRLTDAGRKVYSAIIDSFVTREAEMLGCLNRSERALFGELLEKIIDHSGSWARPY